ncbi:MAG: methionyl-tRNA formyltransferase [Melioribacteraceae bacterium]|nr:methionyl-tRNA formyltransferase [Melioribacteraceae bacterium]MDD3559542.1 methionyl-tRNA formyltransferase [Melioribacteraceae bacterium]
MKIVFFGTPDFAIPSLQKIIKSNHEVKAVVTAPDKERGRGRKVSYTPVKEFAVQNNIEVLQPEKLTDEDFYDELRSINADLFVIVAFRILPEKVFTLPKYGSFNLHGSLLPKYRGAAPIQWALINGDNETGVTTFFLEKKVDTGNLILSKKIRIDETDNFQSLHDKMSVLGADAVIETIDMIESGNVIVRPQDEPLATPAPKITKEICEIDWTKSAIEILNLVRGLSPVPGAFFIKNNKQYKVFNCSIEKNHDLQAGEFRETKNELYVGTGTDDLRILEIQPEGRKRMNAEEFLRGYSLNK